MKDLFFSTMLIVLGLSIIGASLGVALWLVAFGFGAVATIVEHGFALATNIFRG